MYVGTQAHFTLQDGTLPLSNDIFELRFKSSGMLEFDIGPTTLLGTYPGPGNWFNIRLVGELNNATWYVYINGTFQGGTSFAGGDVVGNIHFGPAIGDEYYMEKVEWYAFSDDDCLSPLSPITVTVDGCVGINETIDNDLEMFPNPTDDFVLLKASSTIESVLIYDINGKLIQSNYDINNADYKADLSTFESGIYFMNLVTKVGTVNKKIIVK